jgi:chromosome partitioning protein
MSVLTLASRKGGSGKSTLAMLVSTAMADRGVDVALLDTDPNGSIQRWATALRTGPSIHARAEADAEKLADLIPGLIRRHAVVIVDTAGFGNQAATVAMAAADFVLVPAASGEADIVEAKRTVEFVRSLALSVRRTIPVYVVANSIRHTTLSRHVVAELDRLGLPRLQTTLSHATAYGEMGFTGAFPVTGLAATETASLIRELQEKGGLP